MRAFRLTDAEFGALAAGRPTPDTLAVLRKAQLSRNLLLLSEILRSGTKIPYAAAPSPQVLADPATGLWAATAVSMIRSGGRPPARSASTARTLVTTCDDVTLRVRLEDADPLRDRVGLTPTGPLDDDAVAHWQHALDDAWRLLVRRHPEDAAILAAVLRMIVPVEPDPGAGGISATSAHAYGAVAMSAPADGRALAVGLLHETAHSVLNATTLLFDLTRPTAERGYSPWRDDPRPPSGVLHGAYAYLAVTRFRRLEAAAGGQLAAFEFARWRSAVATAAEGLLTTPGVLTTAGQRFVSALRDEADSWHADPVDPEIARLAEDANTDHRVRWRLRNLRIDPAAIDELVRARRAAVPRPPTLPPAEVLPAPRRLEASARLDRVHALLRAADRTHPPRPGDARTRPTDPTPAPRPGDARTRPTDPTPALRPGEGGGSVGGDGSQGDHRGRAGGGVRPGDDAWLGGDRGTGQEAYLWILESVRTAEADIDAALAGLALVSPWAVLRERPEIVRQTWLALGRPSLISLVEWFDRA